MCRPLACAGLICVLVGAGCARTVHRIGGPEVVTPAGDPQNECEKRAWIILAPTSREVPTAGKSVTVEDGLGMYKVGRAEPEAIPDYEEDIGPSPVVTKHKEGVRPHDRDRVIAMGLGAASIASIAVGTILFVSGLSRTKTVTNSETGLKEEETDIDGTKAGWGAGVAVVGGFGFGAAGLAVNPDSAERAEADAYRYVFTPEDNLETVRGLVYKHNLSARKKCGHASGTASSAPSSGDVESETPNTGVATGLEGEPTAPESDEDEPTAPEWDEDEPLARE